MNLTLSEVNLKAAKMGIWSFHHGDNSINRGGPPAFGKLS